MARLACQCEKLSILVLLAFTGGAMGKEWRSRGRKQVDKALADSDAETSVQVSFGIVWVFGG